MRDTIMVSDKKHKQIEYNIAKSRLQQIGMTVNAVRVSHLELEQRESFEDLVRYYTALKELAMELIPYLDEIDRKNIKEELEDKKPDKLEYNPTIEEYSKDEKEDLEELDQKLNGLRIDLGLDIPQSTKPEEGEEMLS